MANAFSFVGGVSLVRRKAAATAKGEEPNSPRQGAGREVEQKVGKMRREKLSRNPAMPAKCKRHVLSQSCMLHVGRIKHGMNWCM